MSAVSIDVGRERRKDSAATESSAVITQQRYDEVAEALRAYKASTGATWEDVARALGGDYKASSINVFATGSYKLENAQKIVEHIEQFLALIEERRGVITQPAFVMTSISKRIFAMIRQASLLTKIGVAACESGTGKSRTLEEWHATHLNSVLIRANRTFCPTTANTVSASSPYTTLYKVALALGCANLSTSRSQMLLYDSIISTARNSNRVLIIDEAHFLPAEALDVIRTINEDAHIPIFLAGHAGLYDRSPRDPEATIAYRSRAIRERMKTAEIRQTDVDLIATQIVGVDVARDAQKVLQKEAQGRGGFRRLVTVLQLAQTYRDSETVTKAHVLRAIDERPEDGGGL